MSEEKKVSESDSVSTFTFGNFLVKIELDADVVKNAIPPSLLGYILDGCTQRLQRKPASAVEKALEGYEKRPAAFKRDSIPFSAKGVALLEATMGEAVADVATVSVTEYVAGVGADPKFTYERNQIREVVEGGKSLEAIATKAGFEGETGEVEDLNVDFLRAVRAMMEAARKNAL